MNEPENPYEAPTSAVVEHGSRPNTGPRPLRFTAAATFCFFMGTVLAIGLLFAAWGLGNAVLKVGWGPVVAQYRAQLVRLTLALASVPFYLAAGRAFWQRRGIAGLILVAVALSIIGSTTIIVPRL